MSANAWIVVAVIVVLAAVVAWALVLRSRRARQTELLRGRFGTEYDHAVHRTVGRRTVEKRLTAIAEQRDALDVRPLPASARADYAEQWAALQSSFVDEPGTAVAQADELVNAVLRDRGYPLDAFDDRVALLATDHPDVATNYRAAHEVHARQLKTGRADTEALRLAFVQYRSVFGELTREVPTVTTNVTDVTDVPDVPDVPIDVRDGVRRTDS